MSRELFRLPFFSCRYAGAEAAAAVRAPLIGSAEPIAEILLRLLTLLSGLTLRVLIHCSFNKDFRSQFIRGEYDES